MPTITQARPHTEGLRRLDERDCYWSFHENMGEDATRIQGGRSLKTIARVGDKLSALLLPYKQLKLAHEYGLLGIAMRQAESAVASIESDELTASMTALQMQIKYHKEAELAKQIDEANEIIAEGRYWAEMRRSSPDRDLLAPLSRIYPADHLVTGDGNGYGIVILGKDGQEGLPESWSHQGRIFVAG